MLDDDVVPTEPTKMLEEVGVTLPLPTTTTTTTTTISFILPSSILIQLYSNPSSSLLWIQLLTSIEKPVRLLILQTASAEHLLLPTSQNERNVFWLVLFFFFFSLVVVFLSQHSTCRYRTLLNLMLLNYENKPITRADVSTLFSFCLLLPEMIEITSTKPFVVDRGISKMMECVRDPLPKLEDLEKLILLLDVSTSKEKLKQADEIKEENNNTPVYMTLSAIYLSMIRHPSQPIIWSSNLSNFIMTRIQHTPILFSKSLQRRQQQQQIQPIAATGTSAVVSTASENHLTTFLDSISHVLPQKYQPFIQYIRISDNNKSRLVSSVGSPELFVFKLLLDQIEVDSSFSKFSEIFIPRKTVTATVDDVDWVGLISSLLF